MAESDFEQDLQEALLRSVLDGDVKAGTLSREGEKGSESGEPVGASTTPDATTGKARRRKRRLRHEPESIIGE